VAAELVRLRRLADRLLVVAAAEHPGFLQRTPVDLEALVLETLHRWSPTPRRWTLGEVNEATVDCDPDRIQLALDALIENAVKHTNSGDPLELSLRRQGDSVDLIVSDSGPGIDTGALDRIFDRFARADSSRSRDDGGLGLGLSLVKAIAEAHGGSVHVRSALGTGSTFWIRLPLMPSERPSTSRRSADTVVGQVPVG
jgi:two-component system OmpR family sensor kinase